MNKNKIYYKIGRDNKEFWALKQKLKPFMKMIEEKTNGFYIVYHAITNEGVYEIVDDWENGIPYSIEKIQSGLCVGR